jgi:hypothetical protein
MNRLFILPVLFLTLLVGNLAFSADPKTKNINLKCSSETYLGDP